MDYTPPLQKKIANFNDLKAFTFKVGIPFVVLYKIRPFLLSFTLDYYDKKCIS
jgi:hypothetical protein